MADAKMTAMPTTSAEKVRRRGVGGHSSENGKGGDYMRIRPRSESGDARADVSRQEWASPFRMMSMGLETESKRIKIRRVVGILCIFVFVGTLTVLASRASSNAEGFSWFSYFSHFDERRDIRIEANDLYGTHDILLTGYAAPFVQENSEGQKIVQRSALALARQFSVIHPFPRCREAVQHVSYNARTVSVENDRDFINRVAKASWSCLPASYMDADFEHPFTVTALTDHADALESRRPALIRKSAAGSCRHSSWDRTCALWASIHASALEAEMAMARERNHGLSPVHVGVDALSKFLPHLLTVLVGGITQCRG